MLNVIVPQRCALNVVLVLHIYSPVTRQRQILTIGHWTIPHTSHFIVKTTYFIVIYYFNRYFIVITTSYLDESAHAKEFPMIQSVMPGDGFGFQSGVISKKRSLPNLYRKMVENMSI